MVHNQLQIARQVLKSYTKCVGRQETSAGHHASEQKHKLSNNINRNGGSSHLCCSFIHSGHFYSAPSSPLLLRGAPDYSTDTVWEFHAEAHRQLQVKGLQKVPTWRLERESNPRPSG